MYTQLVSIEDDEWHAAYAKTLDEEDELLKDGFEFVRFSD
jgi:hypothetical protein